MTRLAASARPYLTVHKDKCDRYAAAVLNPTDRGDMGGLAVLNTVWTESEAGGSLRARTLPALNLLLLLLFRACVQAFTLQVPSNSCGHVRSRFECLFSVTLLRGTAAGLAE